MSAPPLPAEATRPAELDEATIVAWSRRTRAAKGLPAKIEDPATLRRIVTLAFGTGPPNGRNSDRT
jgi:hypothetical protein